MEAVAKMKDSATKAYVRGDQYVGPILVCHAHVIPMGTGLYGKLEHCAALGIPLRKTIE